MPWYGWFALGAVLLPPLTRSSFITGIKDYNMWKRGELRWGDTLLDHWWFICAIVNALFFLLICEPLFNWFWLSIVLRALPWRGHSYLSTTRLKYYERNGDARQVVRAWAICAKLAQIDEDHCHDKHLTPPTGTGA